MVRKDVFASLKRCPVVFSAAQKSGIASCRRPRSRCAATRVPGRQMDTATAADAAVPLKDRPLFAVVGCTGTGKTKLGVRLAKELDGEVVSADSIQVSTRVRSSLGFCVGTEKSEKKKNEIKFEIFSFNRISAIVIVIVIALRTTAIAI